MNMVSRKEEKVLQAMIMLSHYSGPVPGTLDGLKGFNLPRFIGGDLERVRHELAIIT
jgi:hypothetical protein